MSTQNYQNHSTLKYLSKTQIAHYIIIACINIFSAANFIRSLYGQNGRIDALIILLIGISLFLAYFIYRGYSLKAQDRAIRAEENLRHYVLTSKLLDKNLKLSQIIALRFASDEEFVDLAQRALKENLSNKEIKISIKNWREDIHRA